MMPWKGQMILSLREDLFYLNNVFLSAYDTLHVSLRCVSALRAPFSWTHRAVVCSKRVVSARGNVLPALQDM